MMTKEEAIEVVRKASENARKVGVTDDELIAAIKEPEVYVHSQRF